MFPRENGAKPCFRDIFLTQRAKTKCHLSFNGAVNVDMIRTATVISICFLFTLC